MDDVRRNALVALGAVFMSGGIAWVVTISVVGSWSWEMRVIPPAAMFIGGAALVVWAVVGGATSRRAVLGRAISEGHRMLQSDGFTANMWLEWEGRTADALRDHVGSPEAYEFMNARAAGGGTFQGMAEAQLRYLEGLRKSRFRKRR